MASSFVLHRTHSNQYPLVPVNQIVACEREFSAAGVGGQRYYLRNGHGLFYQSNTTDGTSLLYNERADRRY